MSTAEVIVRRARPVVESADIRFGGEWVFRVWRGGGGRSVVLGAVCPPGALSTGGNTVSVESVRKFAEAILEICDGVEE